jgi:hypothetical protein
MASSQCFKNNDVFLQMPTHLELILKHLDWSHNEYLRIIGDWPVEKLAASFVGAPNHVLWTTGHLATANQWFAGLLDGKPKTTSEAFEKAHGHESVPVSDAGKYAPLAELRVELEAGYGRLRSVALATSEADLLKPTINESYGICDSRLSALQVAAYHTAWHSGQVSMLRRALGLKSVYA